MSHPAPAYITILARLLDATKPIEPEEITANMSNRTALTAEYMAKHQAQSALDAEKALLAAERARLVSLMDAIDDARAEGKKSIDRHLTPALGK